MWLLFACRLVSACKADFAKKDATLIAECQAKKKAWAEKYSCMDSKQLPPGFIGAQLLLHAPPFQPCISTDKDLLRLPACF